MPTTDWIAVEVAVISVLASLRANYLSKKLTKFPQKLIILLRGLKFIPERPMSARKKLTPSILPTLLVSMGIVVIYQLKTLNLAELRILAYQLFLTEP